MRGNHDPYDAKFPLSSALYATSITQLRLGDLAVAIVPFVRGAKRIRIPEAWGRNGNGKIECCLLA